MKKIILLLVLLTSFIANAQRFKEVLKWEIETQAGGIVFGVSETKEDANYIMKDFQKRNAGTKYEIKESIPKFKYATINVKKTSDNPVEVFKAVAGKAYKVLSAEDIVSMEIIKKSNLANAVVYYVTTRNTTKKYAENRLKNIYGNLERFRI